MPGGEEVRMCLHDRRTRVLAAVLVFAATAALAESSSTTAAAPNSQVIWKNGEVVPPLPDDPAVRRAARDQLTKNAAARKTAAAVMFSGSTLTGSVSAQRAQTKPETSLRAADPTLSTWFDALHARLQPPDATNKNDTEPARTIQPGPNTAGNGPLTFPPATITSFDGIDDTGLRPGAPDIAAGPDHLLLVTTDRFAVMDKCGNTLFTDTFRHFLSLSATAAQYTPRAIYDEWNNRWIVVFIGTETNYSVSGVYVMYTTTPDPTGAWFFYSFPNPLVAGLKDFPGVTVTPFDVYLSWDQYNLSTLTFQSAVICGMDKLDFYNGGTTNFYLKTGMTNPGDASLAFSLRPAQLHTFSGFVFFVNSKASGGNFLTMWALSGNVNSSTLTGYNIPVAAYTPPPDVAQPDATLLDAGDCRVLDAVYGFGHLYETHDESYAGQPAVSVTYIDPFDLNNYVWRQTALVGDAYAFGAIDLDANDEITLIYSSWGNVKFPGLGYKFLQFPPATNLGGNVLLHGQDNFNSGSQPYRWGPYAGCARDPIDNRTMWIYGLYASNSPADSWATKVAAVTNLNPSLLSITGTSSYYYSGGFAGGPFTPDTFTYSLENTSQTAANWKLTGIPAWLTASSTSGHVGPGETQTISLHLSPVASTLAEGGYTANLNFQNCTGGGSVVKFIGLGIGHDGSCPGAALPLYSIYLAPDGFDTYSQPGMFMTAIEHMDVCAVAVTAELLELPQLVYARVYAANGTVRGALLAEGAIELVRPGNVRHSIPLAVALEPCMDYEVTVEFTGNVTFDTYSESSVALPRDVGGVVRMRNASGAGNPAATEVAPIQLVTAVSQGCEESTIVDLGGTKGIGMLAPADVGFYVQPKKTLRLCSVALNFGTAPATKVTARVYTATGSSRDLLVAEGSAVVSLPYLNYVDVPISAQLVAGTEYDISVQVQGTTYYEGDLSGGLPILVDGVFNILDGEVAGVGGNATPTLRLGWTADEPATHFTLGKPTGPYPPPLNLGSPLSQGIFVTSLVKQEMYALGVYADVPAGNIITATVYDATGTTRGAVLAFAAAASEAAGLRWHDIPLTVSLLASKDYDFAVAATSVTNAPGWLDTSGLPFGVAGVLTVRNGEKDGLSSNDKLAYMRMSACSATLTPVLSDPGRTPMFLRQPAPNPASGLVRFGYALESDGPVDIALFDVAGRRVADVFSSNQARKGEAHANFDVSKLASGVYFVRLTAPGKTTARKLVVTH
jgi:hypothetical protein